MFHRISFSPFSALPLPQIKSGSSNFTSKLFTHGSTNAFSVSSPPNTEESNLEASHGKGEGGDAGQLEDREAGDDGEAEADNLTRDGDTDIDDELVYEAESPDEAALVHAARAYSCTLRGRSAESLSVDLPGIGPLDVQLLHVLPFDSNRKRMSAVVRHPITGQVVVYTKGADCVIMDLAEAPTGNRDRCLASVQW